MKVKIGFFFIVICALAFGLSSNRLPLDVSPGAMQPYLNGIFPAGSPGIGGSWYLEEPAPAIQIPSPLRIIPFPNSDDLLVLSKLGEIHRINLDAGQDQMVLDFKDRAFKKGEAGAVGMVLHPKFGDPGFPDKQHVFVFYRWKPQPDSWSEKGFNRLSKFTWNENQNQFDLNSEEILIQQYDRSTWHNGGGMFFGPDGFLYISFGDEGMDDFQVDSNQRLDGGFFSGIMRIDVDMDPTKSHPIRRQPLANANPPQGWGDTYSQGYFIPDINPWQSPDSSHLEEYIAIGVRSPFSMSYDPVADQIWVADVGSSVIEEINKVDVGDNLQWPYLEGKIPSEDHQPPNDIIGNERASFFEYDRSLGSCVIGGFVYNDDLFSSLKSKYLFADYNIKKIMALSHTGLNTPPEVETLIPDLSSASVSLPQDPGISGVFPTRDGEILITVMSQDFTLPGKIFRLSQKDVLPDPPGLISELGVFSDLENLEVAEGILPYEVNAALWSDRAVKKRWIALPNDGLFDSDDEQINFYSNKEWEFPEGTVFIKHFDLPVNEADPDEMLKLETRFFVIAANNQAYGLTYKWNEEGTEAFLQGGGSSSNYNIYDGNDIIGTQTWDFPGRDHCMSCHTENANFVLGVKTHQLNGEIFYPQIGQFKNQLAYLSDIGAFNQKLKDPATYPRAIAIDEETADLELRIRSYLDANCASCHRLGGVPMINLDLRFSLPLYLQNMVNLPVQSQASTSGNMIVKPGDHANSEIWIRDSGLGSNKMPPIARNIVDEVYVDALAEWIDQLSEDAGKISHFIIYPNPSSGWLSVRISNDWQGPFNLSLRDMSGKNVLSYFSESPSISLGLNHLPAGVYYLEVNDFTEQKALEKVILL